MDTSPFFHHASKDHARGHPPIPARSSDWPVEWRTTYYKTYPRLDRLVLGNPAVPKTAQNLSAAIASRTSSRDFARALVSRDWLSILLRYACGNVHDREDGRQGRAQPSGGARFPIEAYPIIFRTGGDLGAGVYHYDVRRHEIEILRRGEFSDDDIDRLVSYAWAKNAAVLLVLTAVFSRTQAKYGDRGYRYVLLEAGHIGQNVYLMAQALGLKCCALGGTRDEAVEELLGIDGVAESLVYALAIGA